MLTSLVEAGVEAGGKSFSRILSTNSTINLASGCIGLMVKLDNILIKKLFSDSENMSFSFYVRIFL